MSPRRTKALHEIGHRQHLGTVVIVDPTEEASAATQRAFDKAEISAERAAEDERMKEAAEQIASGTLPEARLFEGQLRRGEIEVTVGAQRSVLGPGDAYLFDSRAPHRFRNPGSIPARIISACTPPYL